MGKDMTLTVNPDILDQQTIDEVVRFHGHLCPGLAVGIQAGYSFFAPNVPSHHRLTFELFYDDGHVEYESPHVRSKAAALRLDSLLDRLPDERYESIREALVKMLAFSVWREHPDVKKVRATLEAVHLPSITDFEHGKAETFEPMFSFDFSLRGQERQ